MSLSSDIAAALKNPVVGMNTVVIRAGALDQLAAAVGGAHHVAYLADGNTFATAQDDDVKATVRSALEAVSTVTNVVIGGEVHADEETVRIAVDGCKGADVVVTFGSGTLCDIGKVAASTNGARHIVIQSAASVNGYADDQSVLLINGVKRTTHSAWPDTLLVDVDVVAAAPANLNASGLGDMISMFSAPADWYLATQFGMDRGWNPDAAVMTRRHGELLLEIAPGLRVGDPQAAATLSEFVTLSGISMGVAGQTSPSSGMEHVVSHMLDMAKGARHESTAFHGEQVGIATVVATVVWARMAERIEAGKLREFKILDDAEAKSRIDAAFGWMDEDGSTARECWNDYSKKIAHLRSIDANAAVAKFQEQWSAHKAQLDAMLIAPHRVADALREAGAPLWFSDLSHPASSEDVTWALTNCHLMRNRFSIADLAFATGNWTDEDVASAIAEARSLAAAGVR